MSDSHGCATCGGVYHISAPAHDVTTRGYGRISMCGKCWMKVCYCKIFVRIDNIWMAHSLALD